MIDESAAPDGLSCRRCARPVAVERGRYDVFEQMHYVCFHYEFEHDPADPDEECSAGGCPSSSVYPRPERQPANALALGDVDAWFVARGLRIVPSEGGCSTGVDLASRDGLVLASRYGLGPTLAEAAESARRRWRAEQHAGG